MNCNAVALLRSVLISKALLLVVFTAQATSHLPLDSTGSEWRNGKLFVIHRVDPGQTLYSILRRYGTSFEEYKAASSATSEQVQTNELLRIPYTRKSTLSSKGETPAKGASAKPEKTVERPDRHEVQAGETLYSIARRYNLAVEDLKQWNNLPDAGGVQTGQVLMLNGALVPKKPARPAAEIAKEQLKPQPIETKPAPPVREPEATPPPIAKADKPDKSEVNTAQREPDEPTVPEAVRSSDGPVPNAAAVTRHWRETGLAEVIEVSDKSGKYLALHRTAPVGTMVTVRNEANNQAVMVKIIGKLPDTGLNDRIIIKLSPGAFERLSPVDRRFRAEVSYVLTQ